MHRGGRRASGTEGFAAAHHMATPDPAEVVPAHGRGSRHGMLRATPGEPIRNVPYPAGAPGTRAQRAAQPARGVALIARTPAAWGGRDAPRSTAERTMRRRRARWR